MTYIHSCGDDWLGVIRKAVQEKENIVCIENATHCVFYDKDPSAEEKAVEAVLAFATRNE